MEGRSGLHMTEHKVLLLQPFAKFGQTGRDAQGGTHPYWGKAIIMHRPESR